MYLEKVNEVLQARVGPQASGGYEVPRLWQEGENGIAEVDPHEYYGKIVAALLARPAAEITPCENWSAHACVYNMFVRCSSAFDHDGDGALGMQGGDPTINAAGFRETGTFLKALAQLAHLERMGCNTLYLLPVTAIGRDGGKGDLRSPYAIRDPYALDETLSDPLLGDMPVEEQFGALVEGARHLGMRVVLEFVFRTASKDSAWAEAHPEWFYWIPAEYPDRSPEDGEALDGYGAPPFSPAELEKLKGAAIDPLTNNLCTPARLMERVSQEGQQLVEPPEAYRSLFKATPERVERRADGSLRGHGPEGLLRIPGAFADWPPDDIQPPWGDVTYLRMYARPDRRFDYIAYNTIRVYDPELARPEFRNRELWDRIGSIVPHYQKTFGVDGVMIDMGHALPPDLSREIKERAWEVNPDFAFWEENFAFTEKSAEERYQLVVGHALMDLHDPRKLRYFLGEVGRGVPVHFMATAENHNTPRVASRAGGASWARASWVLLSFLLRSVPFVHSGFELGESHPVNTGLDFSPEDLERLADKPLPLFDRWALSWDGGKDMTAFVSRVLELRRRHHEVATDPAPTSYRVLEDCAAIVGYERFHEGTHLAILCNTDGDHDRAIDLEGAWRDALSGKSWTDRIHLAPLEAVILEAVDPREAW